MSDEEDHDEDDYMSDAFLKPSPESVFTKVDRSWGERKRRQLVEQSGSSRNDSVKKCSLSLTKQIELSRKEGLSKKLDSTNKGFMMLTKMGFQDGDSLGKLSSSSGASAIKEPLKITVKNDRKGLGGNSRLSVDTAMKQLNDDELVKRQNGSSFSVASLTAFRAMKSVERSEKQIVRDLCQSQKVCMNLDQQCGVDAPLSVHFWPPSCEDQDDIHHEVGGSSPTNDNEIGAAQEVCLEGHLSSLTEYLANTYHYCMWCAIQYDNLNELKSCCPGPSRLKHFE